LLIPAFKLGSRNRLEYDFRFSPLHPGSCRDTPVENVRAMIDPDSTIDFSGYPHYAEMPQLGYFAASGFPFTRFADLSQTAVVLPQVPATHDIEAMLALLARLGEATGYPATRLAVTGPDELEAMRGKDLLLIGATGRQPLLADWSKALPAVIDGPGRMIRKTPGTLDRIYSRFGIATDPPPDSVAQRHLRGNGPLAALLGFASPLNKERSVVALTAVEPDQMQAMLEALQNEDAVGAMQGSVILAHGGKVESIDAGAKYTLGKLPVWTAIWFPLSAHPALLAAMSVIAVLVFAFALWRTLRAVARRRLDAGDPD